MHSSTTMPPAEPTALGISSQKLGIWVLLGSEAVFFSSLIVTYIVFHGRGTSGPTSHEVLDVTLTAVNTFVLICSSLTMVTALSAIERGAATATRNWLAATALLGLAFLTGLGHRNILQNRFDLPKNRLRRPDDIGEPLPFGQGFGEYAIDAGLRLRKGRRVGGKDGDPLRMKVLRLRCDLRITKPPATQESQEEDRDNDRLLCFRH